MLWKAERYNEENYKRLIGALRHKNNYRYGLLLKEEPQIKRSQSFKVFELPEGYLILSRKPKGLHYEYQDLKEKPIKLTYFILLYSEKYGRLMLQINRDFVRLQLKRARAIKIRDLKWYVKEINNLTRELREVSRYAFVFPETQRAYRVKLREIVETYLTSVLGMTKKQAQDTIKRYLLLSFKSKKVFERDAEAPHTNSNSSGSD